MESEIPQITEQKKSRLKKILMFFLFGLHLGFFFSQSLHLPLTLEQLFTFGELLLLTDVGLLVIFGVKLLRRQTDA